jgi:hypothetical protein
VGVSSISNHLKDPIAHQNRNAGQIDASRSGKILRALFPRGVLVHLHFSSCAFSGDFGPLIQEILLGLAQINSGHSEKGPGKAYFQRATKFWWNSAFTARCWNNLSFHGLFQ